jgi:hypothetical protein
MTTEGQEQKNVITTLPIKKIKLKKENELQEKKLQKAYNIIESSLKQESFIKQDNKIETIVDKNNDDGSEDKSNPDNDNLNTKSRIYRVKSSKDKDKFYEVDLEKSSCTCADFIFRHVKCKHIIATEIILP